MSLTVKSISLWRKEVVNQVGVLAQTLEPVGANLRVLMEYRYPGDATKAAIELYPLEGKRVTAAATETGLLASSIPTLIVEGARFGTCHRGGDLASTCQHDVHCCPNDRAKVFGGTRFRDRK